MSERIAVMTKRTTPIVQATAMVIRGGKAKL